MSRRSKGRRLHEESDSEFTHHEPCPACQSKGEDRSGDNLARYTDGHGYCHKCGYYEHPDGNSSKTGSTAHNHRRSKMAANLIEGGEYRALKKRKLTEETCRKFGYTVGKYKGKTVQIAPYHDWEGRLVAQHIRYPNKDFIWTGEYKDALLFGQNVWRDSGKMLVITEGEIDAMSISQIQGNRWPVVSIQTGASSAPKAIKKSLEWIEGFETVIFAFDMDEPGQEAARKCAVLLTPGKAKIARLPLKDANECLVAGKTKELIDSLWGAKTFRPDGIITIEDLEDEVTKPVEWGLPWPWEPLTKATYGRRPGEVYTLGAGTGIGKTDVFTQIITDTITTHKLPVGLFYLEQPPVETLRRVAGKYAGKRFHVPDAGWEADELKKAVADLKKSGKLYLYNHFGSTDWEVIKSRMRYMVVAHDVRHVFLDHLTALAAQAEDERRELEALMEEIATMAQELGFCVYIISHLATPDGTPHEEGGRVMIRHFKGSRAIGYWSHFMFGLERNQQAESEIVRKTTTFRILKDRYTGQATGEVFYLRYDESSGLLVESDPPLSDDCPFDPDTQEGGSDF